MLSIQFAVINQGAVIEQGTHDQLKKAGGGYASLLTKYEKAVKVVEKGDEEDHEMRDNVFYTVSTKKLVSMRQLVVGFSLLFLPH
jgi:hypothetical protein